MEMQASIFLAYILALVILLLLGRLMVLPMKLLLRVIYNGILGAAALWVINLIGSFIGFGITLNPVTALTAGLLGVPGVLMLYCLQFILK